MKTLCSGGICPKGDRGVAGPPGPTGEAGAVGPDGPRGPKGLYRATVIVQGFCLTCFANKGFMLG